MLINKTQKIAYSRCILTIFFAEFIFQSATEMVCVLQTLQHVVKGKNQYFQMQDE